MDNEQINSRKKNMLKTLKEWRDENGWPRARMAEALGITSNSLSRYESGSRVPDLATFEKMVQVTDGEVSPNSFLGEQSRKLIQSKL